METLEDKLTCIFAEVGTQIGDIVRCMVEQEIASHNSRILQLNLLLSGQGPCNTDVVQQDTGT